MYVFYSVTISLLYYVYSTKMYRTGTPNEAKINKKAMLEALNVLRFGGSVTEKFNARLSSVPAGL